jgi:hypothetical protein
MAAWQHCITMSSVGRARIGLVNHRIWSRAGDISRKLASHDEKMRSHDLGHVILGLEFATLDFDLIYV